MFYINIQSKYISIVRKLANINLPFWAKKGKMFV